MRENKFARKTAHRYKYLVLVPLRWPVFEVSTYGRFQMSTEA